MYRDSSPTARAAPAISSCDIEAPGRERAAHLLRTLQAAAPPAPGRGRATASVSTTAAELLQHPRGGADALVVAAVEDEAASYADDAERRMERHRLLVAGLGQAHQGEIERSRRPAMAQP